MMSQFEPEEIQLERERVVLEEIKNNPNSHHNAIVKIIVPKYMAKTTFEKTRDSLIKKNILSFTMKGNKKFYHIIENYQMKSLQLIERMTHVNFQHLQHQIKRLNENYHHKDLDEKISISSQLLKELLRTDNGFTLLDAVKNSKKTLYKDEHLEIQEMISVILQNITNDNDVEFIFPPIVSFIEFNFVKNHEI